MVEFALVAPLLFVLLFGMIDFGKAFHTWIDETQLAAEGARLAAVNFSPPSGTLQSYIRQQADTSELRNGGGSLAGPATVCISFPTGTSNNGDPVTITVKSVYNWMPLLTRPLPFPFGGNRILSAGSVTVSGSATMRLERAAGAPLNYSSGSGGTGTCP